MSCEQVAEGPASGSSDNVSPRSGEPGGRRGSPISASRREAFWKITWVEAYGLFLFGVMVAFYAVTFWLICQLINLSADLLINILVPANELASILSVFGLVALGALLVQLVLLFASSIVGLVTPKYDTLSQETAGIAVPRGEEPELFELVDAVARRVGTRCPDELRITPSAECYVIEERSFAARAKRRLTLVLGLPHLSVLRVPELEIIVAHELAHVRSGDTRLAVFRCRFLESLWVVLQRRKNAWWRWIDLVYVYCNLYQQVFACLSALIRKHQELQADAVSATLFGGQLASETLLKEWLLGHQFGEAVKAYKTRTIGDGASPECNVFRWFVQRWHNFSPEGHQYLRRRLAEVERSSFFDSHPTIQCRINTMIHSGIHSGDRPLSQGSKPARELLRHLARLEERLHDSVLQEFDPSFP